MSKTAGIGLALLIAFGIFGTVAWMTSAAAAPARATLPDPADRSRPAVTVRPVPETAAANAPAQAAPTATVSFSLSFKGIVSPYSLFSTFVMPGEELALAIADGGGGQRYAAEAAGSTLAPTGEGSWSWRAPREPGLYPLTVSREGAESILLNAFVLTPYDGMEALNGYRIGRYERLPLRGNPVYNPPGGFIEVTPELLDTRVSPHFTLRQFLCKQDVGAARQYLLLREPLLLKLESVLAEVREAGIEAGTFTVMSGYRTPWYNSSIGNSTRYSRHGYGDAADIFIDEDGDGVMDDLDGDGRVDEQDAKLLYDLVEGMRYEAHEPHLVGGLGLYGPAPHRGPFVHIDTRGFRARW